MHQDKTYLSYFSRCQHPSVIYNKYTASRVTVPCGHCQACLLRKSRSATHRCQVQASRSRYVYFVTLTYETPYIPTARIDKCLDICESFEDFATLTDNDYQISVVPRSPFMHKDKRRIIDFGDDSSLRFQFSSSSEDIDYIRVKSDLTVSGKYPGMNGLVPYLNYPDFSAFYKRLRRILHHRLHSYEKIYSYVTGEYGPKTLRPHFHILFFFDSDRVASYLRSSIRAAWPFGRIDVQLARGEAASYCAGYVNSYACLPRLYQQVSFFRPFGRFSTKFAFSFFEDYFDPNPSSFTYFQNGIPLSVDGKVVYFPCPRAYIDSFFPKFTNDVHSSGEIVCRLVTSISRCLDLPSKDGVMTSFSYMRMASYLYRKIYELKSSNVPLPDDLRILCEYSRLSEYLPLFPDEGVLAIYRLLLKYRNFMKYWIPSTVPPSSPLFCSYCKNAVALINKFYNDLDYKSLKQQLQYESYYFDDHPFSDDSLILFHSDSYSSDDVVRSMRQNPLVTAANGNNSVMFYERIKHKSLNDSNNIFTY